MGWLFFIVFVIAVAALISKAIKEQRSSTPPNPERLDVPSAPPVLDLDPRPHGTTAADEHPFAVIDLETTGFDPNSDRIVEVAVVRLDERGRVTSRWTTMINPERSTAAAHIHGLSDGALTQAPRFGEIAEELVHQMSGAIVVAHNASFENRFLSAEFARAGVELSRVPTICTLALAREAFPHFEKHTLDVCCQHLGISNPDAHTALADAEVTGHLLAAALCRAPTRMFASSPWRYGPPTTSHARPRDASGEHLSPPPTPHRAPAGEQPLDPLCGEAITRTLRRAGFVAQVPAEGSLPMTPGHQVGSNGDGTHTVCWTDPDAADRQCTKMGKVLRDAGYSARVSRANGVCVNVKGYMPPHAEPAANLDQCP